MDLIARFSSDVHVKDAVFAYLFEKLDEEALEAVYKGEKTEGYKEAKIIIQKLKEELTQQNAIVREKKPNSSR